MKFTSTMPSVSMPQSMIWSLMQQAPLVAPETPHVVTESQHFDPGTTHEKLLQPTISKTPITIFIGNISEKVPDNMIQHILATCGNIASWKNEQGFGFCEYYRAEAALCAIKVLHDMEIGGKKLVVKVDTKTQETLDQFKTEKKDADDSEENQKFEINCRQRIDIIIKDHNDEITKEEKQNENNPSIVDGVGFVMVPNEDENKKKIFQEIGKFREDMKKQEKEKLIERHTTLNNPDSEENRRRREEREKRYKEKEEKEKRKKEERDKRDREKKERREKKRRDKEKERKKRIEKENRKEKIPEENRGYYDKNRLREKQMKEEELELKKDGDRQEEKELAYQKKLQQWLIIENQKNKKLSKQCANKQMIQEKREINAKKLKDFLEDYDDEKDDQNYYKGKDLKKRIKLREKELEKDGRDRQKEKDELLIIQEKIYNNVELKNPELEFAKVLKAREKMYKPKSLIDVAEKQKDKLKPYEVEIENQKNMEVERECQWHVIEKALTPNPQQPATPPSVESQTPTTEFVPMTQPTQLTTFMIKKRMDIKNVFESFEDESNNEEALPRPKKRKLGLLDKYTDKKKKKCKAVEEKKKKLIKRIPSDKDDLFSYHLDWTVINFQLVEKRIRPWVNRKIIEYIGEPEPSLVDFICSKVVAKSSPQTILNDVQMVLDEEAEVFVVKMWRLLVYEVEIQKLKLIKLKENGHKDPYCVQ